MAPQRTDRTDLIIAHITGNGPKTQKQLARELAIPESSISYYLTRPLQRGKLTTDKVLGPDGKREVLCYRLPSQNKLAKVSDEAPKYDPMDPFGLVAKRAAGVKVDLPRAAKQAPEVPAQAQEVAPEVVTTILDNDPSFTETTTETMPSPIIQRILTEHDQKLVEEARDILAENPFSCALWSNGLLEMRRGDKMLARLTPAEVRHFSEFLGRVVV